MSNSRPPQSHSLLGAEHGDATTGAVQRGDLAVGSLATGSAKWTRLPLGGANRCLMSNGVDAIWNTCLFTGFHAGSVPFTGADGTLAEAPLHFTWDNSNRRLSVGSNLNLSTLTVHDGASGGTTTLTVRGGNSQGQHALQAWQNTAGTEQASIDAEGVLAVRSVEAVSGTTRAAWRESGTVSDPSVRADGDAWYNTTRRARKSFDGGQIHTAPQVLCAGQRTHCGVGNHRVPWHLFHSGGLCSRQATGWRFALLGASMAAPVTTSAGAGAVAVAGSIAVPGTLTLLDQKGEIALYDGGAILDGASKGSNSFTGAPLWKTARRTTPAG